MDALFSVILVCFIRILKFFDDLNSRLGLFFDMDNISCFGLILGNVVKVFDSDGKRVIVLGNLRRQCPAGGN